MPKSVIVITFHKIKMIKLSKLSKYWIVIVIPLLNLFFNHKAFIQV